MYLYETHMHTAPVSACAGASPEEQVRAYKDRGYAGIIVTDHFINGSSGCPRGLPWAAKMLFFVSGWEKAKEAGDACGLDVFFGWEFNVNGTEFLTYGLTHDFLLAHPGLDKLTVEKYSALVRASGGFLAQAHPFRNARWIANPYPVEPRFVDAYETFNAGNSDPSFNDKARAFAQEHGMPQLAGSDSHFTELSFSSGICLAERAESIFDIIEAVKTGRADLIVP